MKYDVAQTSLESFARCSVDVLSDSQELVLRALREFGPLPNRLLALRMDRPINTVTPRVLELREKGFVRLACVKLDPDTGQNCSWWRAL